MQVFKIQTHEGKRGLWTRLRFPAAVEQSISFEKKEGYDEEIKNFLDEFLKPRSEWLKEQTAKCRMSYQIVRDKNSYRMIKLVVEFRNPKMPALYKLRWS